jgi:hypothetical protein
MQSILTFQIDPNDEKFSITDGGCVDECVATLVSSSVRLDFHTSFIDFKDPAHHKLIITSQSDKSFRDNSAYIMHGELIDCHHGKMNISFGGLRGEFKLSDSQLQTYKSFGSREIYLYVS